MKILLISPLGYPVNHDTRYAGIEQLVFNFSKELSKRHQVSVFGHNESVYPPNVRLYSITPYGDIYTEAERQMFRMYSPLLNSFDVIHDFSHQHYASRNISDLPSLNIFWHAPSVVKFPKAPYNIIGLSMWACDEFKEYYRQEALYMQSICIDVQTYRPMGERGNRFLTLGAMTERKGNYEAALICKEMGVPLDVCGKGYGDQYEQKVRNLCDGEQIRYLGEVSESEKIDLMQTCRGLIYFAKEPEVTNHKLQEAMLCGSPVIVTNHGAMPEIVTHYVNGWLCNSVDNFKEGIKRVDELSVDVGVLRKSYSIEEVIRKYEYLYERVKEGYRW